MEVGSDHQRPLKVLSRFFCARTEYSTTSTLALMPTSRHMRLDGFRHRLVVGRVADGGLDDDLLVLVAGLLAAARAPPWGRTSSGGSEASKWLSPLAIGPLGTMPRPRHSSLTISVAVDGQRQRLLDERVVERLDLAVHGQHVEAGVERAAPRAWWRCRSRARRGRAAAAVMMSTSPLSRAATRGAISGIGADDHAVEVGLAAPVVGVGLQHDLVVLGPRHERTGPVPTGFWLKASGPTDSTYFSRHDLAAVEGQARRQQRVRLLGVDDDASWGRAPRPCRSW